MLRDIRAVRVRPLLPIPLLGSEGGPRRASLLFDGALFEATRNHIATLVRRLKFLEHSSSIVVVRVADEIGAYRIFETLNDRGLRASQADILKNYFFSKAGSRLPEAQMMWNAITTATESLGGESKLSEIRSRVAL